ncbi:organic cation transporter protein-like [Mercenaria mercenaria]|uniref:organic cation transporter protein-like n=1 Tax=Mercenaria mercenaria TaxID=6596 RepID=UPI00234F87BE|nr:organic cation transporter protein-like [Mercenaria mercenaria]
MNKECQKLFIDSKDASETPGCRKLDDVLEKIGGFGLYQKWIFVLTCYPYLLTGFFMLNPVFILGVPEHRYALHGHKNVYGNKGKIKLFSDMLFLDMTVFMIKNIRLNSFRSTIPDKKKFLGKAMSKFHSKPVFRCAIPGYANDTYKIQGEEHLHLINLTIPRSTVEGREYDRCQIFQYHNNSLRFNWLNTTDSRPMVKCNKWVYDRTVFTNTFVAQVDLVCDKEIWVANAGMIFYAGMLLGSMASGVLADRHGRKPVMYMSILVMTAASIGLAWVTVYWLFCLLEFIIGAALVASFMPGYIISIEITSSKKRFWPGIVSNYPYTVGLLVLTGIAYTVRDWFYIELFTSVPGVLMISYWWLIPESPRWLLTKGHVKKAEEVIRTAAKWNKVELPSGDLFDKKSVEEDKSNTSFIQLFTHKILCVRTVLIFFNCQMVVSLAYFGLALNSGNLSVDLYLNFGLSGLVEFPAYLIATYIVERFGRRISYCISMVIGGISCISTIFSINYAPERTDVITLVLALIGRLCMTAAFCIEYIHGAELFPTVVRNAGMSGASLFARAGTMIAPYIAILGESIGGTLGETLPLVIFGAVSLISGITSLWLPETLNRNLPETIEDGEKFLRRKTECAPTSTD